MPLQRSQPDRSSSNASGGPTRHRAAPSRSAAALHTGDRLRRADRTCRARSTTSPHLAMSSTRRPASRRLLLPVSSSSASRRRPKQGVDPARRSTEHWTCVAARRHSTSSWSGRRPRRSASVCGGTLAPPRIRGLGARAHRIVGQNRCLRAASRDYDASTTRDVHGSGRPDRPMAPVERVAALPRFAVPGRTTPRSTAARVL